MLSRRDIEKELGKGINIFPVIRENFKENSINLTASGNAWTMGSGTVYWFGGTDFRMTETAGKRRAKTFSKGSNCVFWDKQGDQHNGYIVLLPHSTTLIETSEVLGVANNIGGALHSKVGLVSKGIGHIGTMLGPGYCGHLLIALHNITDEAIAIKVGSTFVSLSFDYLTTQVMRTSATVSGHLDKFPELGISINEETRSYLTADWKSNIEGIREKMCESEAYKDYKKHIRENSWKELKKYMDANVLGNDVHNINILTVIASESYDSFAKGLQTELAEAVSNRPISVTADLFKGKVIKDARGNEQVIDGETAQAIYFDMVINGYVDKKGALTDKYYVDKANGTIQVAEEVADSIDAIVDILDAVYDSRAMQPENARDKNVELQVDLEKLAMPEFKALWQRISAKSVYVVDFDTEELVQKAIDSLNRNLHVSKVFFKVETGAMAEIKSKDSLLDGSAFSKSRSSTYDSNKQIRSNRSVKYDLIGKLVAETGLTRKAVVEILTGIEKAVFNQFKDNPEEFIIKAAALINDEKATAIIQHITYNVLDERYETDIFTEPTIKGKLGTNVMKVQRHLYDHIVYDSTNERDFATDLDTNTDVAVYVKLPDSFYISTPVGHYNPDWAIAFYEGTVKHIYFVAETKGSMSSMQLRLIEESKIHCAREHFKAISNGNVVYDVVDSYQRLLELVMQ